MCTNDDITTKLLCHKLTSEINHIVRKIREIFSSPAIIIKMIITNLIGPEPWSPSLSSFKAQKRLKLESSDVNSVMMAHGIELKGEQTSSTDFSNTGLAIVVIIIKAFITHQVNFSYYILKLCQFRNT